MTKQDLRLFVLLAKKNFYRGKNRRGKEIVEYAELVPMMVDRVHKQRTADALPTEHTHGSIAANVAGSDLSSFESAWQAVAGSVEQPVGLDGLRAVLDKMGGDFQERRLGKAFSQLAAASLAGPAGQTAGGEPVVGFAAARRWWLEQAATKRPAHRPAAPSWWPPPGAPAGSGSGEDSSSTGSDAASGDSDSSDYEVDLEAFPQESSAGGGGGLGAGGQPPAQPPRDYAGGAGVVRTESGVVLPPPDQPGFGGFPGGGGGADVSSARGSAMLLRTDSGVVLLPPEHPSFDGHGQSQDATHGQLGGGGGGGDDGGGGGGGGVVPPPRPELQPVEAPASYAGSNAGSPAVRVRPDGRQVVRPPMPARGGRFAQSRFAAAAAERLQKRPAQPARS